MKSEHAGSWGRAQVEGQWHKDIFLMVQARSTGRVKMVEE